MIIVSGIYHGAFTYKDKNIRLPDGEIVKNVSTLINDNDPEYNLLLDLIFAYVQPPHSLPDEGGYLQQNPVFLDAVSIFKSAHKFFLSERERISTAWKKIKR